MLADKYGLQYYKLDDHLEEYVGLGAKEGNELFQKLSSMTLDETWLRDPDIQCQEELDIYRAMFIYALRDISAMPERPPIIAEGAGFLPEIMRKMNIDAAHYICIVPSEQFQVRKYSQRTWVKDYLHDCSDSKQAFENWMQRDALFARKVSDDAERLGYCAITVDGSSGVDETYRQVVNTFHLSN